MRSLKTAGRVGLRVVPERIRKNVDDRFFYAVFNLTRVTNDHYPMRNSQEPETNPVRPEDPPG